MFGRIHSALCNSVSSKVHSVEVIYHEIMCYQSVCLIIIVMILSVQSYEQEDNEIHQTAKTYVRLAKLVIDFRNEYHAFNMFIARRDPSKGKYYSI